MLDLIRSNYRMYKTHIILVGFVGKRYSAASTWYLNWKLYVKYLRKKTFGLRTFLGARP